MDYKKAVEAALKGNESAFSALYESTQRDMYYIALKYMKNEEDAMDVLQDSYIKAWQSLATLKEDVYKRQPLACAGLFVINFVMGGI